MKEKTKKLKKLLAFTLAEVLITLSILGVVAAITVPSLIKRQHRNDVAARLAKTVSALHDALSRAEIESGKSYVAKSSEFTTNFDFLNYISPYLNLSKDCTKTTTGCPSWSVMNEDGTPRTVSNAKFQPSTTARTDSNYGYLMLKDGVAIKLSRANGWNLVYIHIDINGSKGPNKNGDDIFSFEITKNNTTGSFNFPKTASKSSALSNCSNARKSNGISDNSCGDYIYLNHFKIPSDYPWLK